METIGSVLKRYREKARQTPASFSKLTKLSEKVIKDLESDNFPALLGDFYIRGYIKTYASYLSLDSKKLLELYQQQIGGLLIGKNAGEMNNYQQQKVYVTPKLLKLAGLTLLAFMIVGYLVFQVNKIFTPPFLTVTTPDQNLIIKESFIEIRGQTEREAHVYINNKEVFADFNGFFTVTLDLREGINLITVSAKKKHSKERTIFREILVQ